MQGHPFLKEDPVTETITLKQLGKRFLSPEANQAFADGNLEIEELTAIAESTTPEELAERLLKPQVNQSFPEIDVEVKEFGMGVELMGLRAWANARDLSLTICVIIALATVACNGGLWLISLLMR
jgi:hypothetical protein